MVRRKKINTLDFNKDAVTSNPVLRWLLMIAGVVFVGIGVLGMFLPLLPTTVFLLLAAACFARSSEKFYNWLHGNKYFGKYISSFRAGQGMTVHSKVTAIAVLWITILLSMYFSLDRVYVLLLLFAVAVGVTIHLIRIPTDKSQKNNAKE